MPSSIEFMCVLHVLSSNLTMVSSSKTLYAVINNFLKFNGIGGTSFIWSPDGVNGVRGLVEGTTLFNVLCIIVESGLLDMMDVGCCVEFGMVDCKVEFGNDAVDTGAVVDLNELGSLGVGRAKPSLSFVSNGVSAGVSTGVVANGLMTVDTKLSVFVSVGVSTP